MKKLLGVAIVLLLVVSTYLLGPKKEIPQLDPTLKSSATLASWMEEEKQMDVIPGCESLVWYANDSSRSKTKYVLLYLHGFSASPVEGDPIHLYVARKYGMNLFAPLLADHGLNSEEPLLDFTAEKWLESCKKAIQIAAALGDSIVLMSTSTGGTSALFLSNSHPQIHSLICYSPNTELARKESDLLLGPWGLQLGRLVNGGKYYNWEVPREARKYWYNRYRLEAVLELKALLKSTMTIETFSSVRKPLFVGYYDKNENERDDQVSIERMEMMFDNASTLDDKKWFVNFYNAGAHCVPSKYFSKDTLAVQQMTDRFIQEVLNIQSRLE